MKDIDNTDQTTGCNYIRRKLKLSPHWLSEDMGRLMEAEKLFNQVLRDEVTLEEWCDYFLNKNQKKQFHNAIRAQRTRNKRKQGEGTKTITLSHQAWLILSSCAMHDKVTLSQLIINCLEKEWLSLSG